MATGRGTLARWTQNLFVDSVVDILVVLKSPVPAVQIVQKSGSSHRSCSLATFVHARCCAQTRAYGPSESAEPMVLQTVQTTVEVLQVQFSDKDGDMFVVVRRYVPMVLQTVQTTVEVLQVQFSDKDGDMLVVVHRHVPMVLQTVQTTVEVLQVQF